jgi:hypothetical protein
MSDFRYSRDICWTGLGKPLKSQSGYLISGSIFLSRDAPKAGVRRLIHVAWCQNGIPVLA